MISLALGRFLARTPWSTFMAFVGVALGVVSIVSVHLISGSIAQRLDALIPDQFAGYSHFLHREGLQTGDYFKLRRAWLAGELDDVVSLAPLIDEVAEVAGHRVRVIGVDLFSAGGLSLQSASTAESQFSWDGVWVDDSLADKLEIPINGTISAPEATVVADIGVAQDLLAWPVSRISYVGVQFRNPWAEIINHAEEVLPGFAAGFPLRPPQLERLADWQVLSLADQHPASQFGKSVLFNISALGLLALLVAWFLIYQVAVAWLRRLWPVLQRLHVLGVEWRLLMVYFVGALSTLGLVAGLAGLVAGYWLAQMLFALATSLAVPSFDLDIAIVGKAMGSAVGVCLIGGYWAFRKAKRESVSSGLSLIWPITLVAAACYGIWVPDSGLAGGFLSIAVLSVLAALLVTPVLLRIRRYGALIPGPYLARLSVRESVWYPQDMGIALAGLTLAVATAIGVGLMVDSFRQDFSQMLERRLNDDIVVDGDEAQLRALLVTVRTDPRISSVQSYAQRTGRIAGVPMNLTATRLDAREASRYGLARTVHPGEVLLSEQAAQLLGVAAGDELVVQNVAATVAAVFASFGEIQPRIIVDHHHELAGDVSALTGVSLTARDPTQVLDSLTKQFPDLTLQLQTELRRTALETFDQTFAITNVLIVIAMMVASIGIYVAVTAMRLNKRAHSTLLVGMGISRLEAFGMDFALGIGIGGVAMLFAIPLGVVFGWILCDVINPRAFGWTVALRINWQSVAVPVLWGMFAATCAGLVRIGRNEDGVAHAAR